MQRHPDVIDELQRLSLCCRCVLRILGTNDEHYQAKSSVELDAILAEAVVASSHSRAAFTDPATQSICPLCYGSLQFFDASPSPSGQSLADSLGVAFAQGRYDSCPYAAVQLSCPTHATIRVSAVVAHLHWVSTKRAAAGILFVIVCCRAIIGLSTFGTWENVL